MFTVEELLLVLVVLCSFTCLIAIGVAAQLIHTNAIIPTLTSRECRVKRWASTTSG